MSDRFRRLLLGEITPREYVQSLRDDATKLRGGPPKTPGRLGYGRSRVTDRGQGGVGGATSPEPYPCNCGGTGTVIYHGHGAFAEIRACSVCEDGKKLADTIIPNVGGEPSAKPGKEER